MPRNFWNTFVRQIMSQTFGFQIFNAGNNHNGAIIPSKELAEKFFPNVPITRELGEHEALFSNRKIREVLGFKEQHNWRKYVKWDWNSLAFTRISRAKAGPPKQKLIQSLSPPFENLRLSSQYCITAFWQIACSFPNCFYFWTSYHLHCMQMEYY